MEVVTRVLLWLGIVVVAFIADSKLHIPAGAMVAGMVAGAVVRLVSPDVGANMAPGGMLFFALTALGALTGLQLDRASVAEIRSAAIPIIGSIAVLLMVGFGLALILRQIGIDFVTAFLAASPGGLSQMAALSVESGANTPFVVVMHLLRVILVVVLAPFITKLLME